MVTRTEHPYIVKDDAVLSGEPVIESTRTPVRTVVERWRRGESADEIVQGLPHLSIAAVFDALSYYADHQAEINEYLRRNRVPEELVDPRALER